MKKYKRTRIIASLAVVSSLAFTSATFAATNSPLNGKDPEIHRTMRPRGTKWLGVFQNSEKPAAVGVVSSVNGTAITLSSKSRNGTESTYTVDASAAAVKSNPGNNAETLSLSDIAAGDRIIVFGTLSDSSIKANSIIKGLKFTPHTKTWHKDDSTPVSAETTQ